MAFIERACDQDDLSSPDKCIGSDDRNRGIAEGVRSVEKDFDFSLVKPMPSDEVGK